MLIQLNWGSSKISRKMVVRYELQKKCFSTFRDQRKKRKKKIGRKIFSQFPLKKKISPKIFSLLPVSFCYCEDQDHFQIPSKFI